MADVLVDTSVWIDFFRHEKGRCGDLLDSLLEEDRVALCGVVEMEIFQGLHENEQEEILTVFRLIPYIDITRDDWTQAGKLWQELRLSGHTIPSTDCLIAQVCLSRDLTLFTLDAHFDGIERLKRVQF